VDCSTAREILSAGLDGETTPLEQESADIHLGSCAECSTWFEAVTAITRNTRLAPAEPVPDLTAAVLAASPAPAATVADALPVVRIGLALVAVAQVVVGQDALFEPAHLAREQGVWEVALAIGFATAAWQPRRASTLVPVVGALVVGLLLASDISHHVIPIVGLALLLASTRLSSFAPRRLAT